MEKVLAIMLVMSLMTVSCNKSGGGTSEETPSKATVSSGDDRTDTTTDTDSGSDSTTDTGSDTTTDNGSDTTPPPPVESNVPALALSFKTYVAYLSGFSTSDETKYNQAVAIVKKVVATEAFKNAVLNFTYNGTKAFVQNNGLTNAEIYQDILDAAETLQPAKNNTLDVGVKLYYENTSTVGYTNGSITYINVNTKFFDTYAVNSVAGNLFHEWLHKLGYDHDSTATTRRPYSVPYAIGYIVRDLGKNFL
jgi:hypothetical protein